MMKICLMPPCKWTRNKITISLRYPAIKILSIGHCKKCRCTVSMNCKIEGLSSITQPEDTPTMAQSMDATAALNSETQTRKTFQSIVLATARQNMQKQIGWVEVEDASCKHKIDHHQRVNSVPVWRSSHSITHLFQMPTASPPNMASQHQRTTTCSGYRSTSRIIIHLAILYTVGAYCLRISKMHSFPSKKLDRCITTFFRIQLTINLKSVGRKAKTAIQTQKRGPNSNQTEKAVMEPQHQLFPWLMALAVPVHQWDHLDHHQK